MAMHNETDLSQTPPIDFEGWWTVPEQWVEEPNQRRNGWSGMIRLTIASRTYYIKKQCNHLCRSLRHPWGWPTVIREYQNIVRLNTIGLRTPKPVFQGVRRSKNGLEGLLVTEDLVGFTDLRSQSGLPQEQREILAIEVGTVLGTMHRAHLQHSCLYDKHIMIRWQNEKPEIALIDLEKLRKTVFSHRAAQHDLEQLKRHQSIWTESTWRLLEESHAQAMKNMTADIHTA